MKVIVCVDDKGGIAFNQRRQSRDKRVYEKIMDMIGENKLYMSEYSSKLFEEDDRIKIVAKPWDEAEKEDYYFAEKVDVSLFEEKIGELILIKWNRVYPADLSLSIDSKNYHLIHKMEFEGNSHDKITMEIYEKNN